jgi:hypothetical protein
MRVSIGRAALVLASMALGAGAAQADKIKNPTAVFSGLDKITGRIVSFEVAIDETVQFGGLQMTPKVCYTRPPTENPNTSSFVEVDEVTLESKVRRIFTGWMFASSPGLHAVEHPVYDIWLVDCKGGTEVIAEPKEVIEEPSPTPSDRQRRQAEQQPGDIIAPTAAEPGIVSPRPAPAQPQRQPQPSRRFFPTNQGTAIGTERFNDR